MLAAPWHRLFLAAFWAIPDTWLLLSCVTVWHIIAVLRDSSLWLSVVYGLRLSDLNKETTLLYFTYCQNALNNSD